MGEKMIVEKEITIKIDISKGEYEAYEECRESGLTNMMNISNVEMITGLSKDKIKLIMMNYNKLDKEFK